MQVSDRWHLWHGLAEAAAKEVAAHSACWAECAPLQEGTRAATTRERWQQVHDLRAKGVGLLDCSRRLGLSLNTVKRYDRAEEPERLQRAPQYRPTLVDPYRDHLRKRRTEEPGAAVQQLLREIRELGYQGSSNLLVRYLNQGRADSDRPHLAPRKAVQLLLTKPENLSDQQRESVTRIAEACPEMKALASLICSFAAMLDPDPGNEERLQEWISAARAAGLPEPALLHTRPRPRHQGRHRRAHPPAPQRPHRRRQQQDENDQTADVRTRRLRPPPPPHPPRMKLRNVTTETATEPFLRQALGGAPLDVGAGRRMGAHPGDHDPPQGVVGLAVAAGVEPAAGDLPRRCGDRGDGAQVRPGGLRAQPLRVVPGGDQQQRGGIRADAVEGEQARGAGGDERDDELVEPVDLPVEELRAPASSRSAMRVA